MRTLHPALALLAVGLLVLAGCTQPAPSDPSPSSPPVSPPPSSPPPAAPPPAASNVTGGFAWDLLRALRAAEPGKDVFFSPASVAAAFCLALEGAEGTTRQSIVDTLNLSAAAEQDCRALTAALMRTRNASGAEVDVANSVWLRDTFAPSVKPAFLEALRTDFRAGAFVRPFGPETVAELNGWVSNATRGMIPKIVEELPDDLVFMLANAIYFKGRWAEPFDANLTAPGPFRLANGTSVEVPLMRNASAKNVSLAAGDGFRMARLPYADGTHAMYILLPDQGRRVDDVSPRSDEAWKALRDAVQPEREVDLRLPKFQLEWGAELKGTLQGMGMEVPFDPGAADFGGIADVRPERLYLSFVAHKAALEVDEEGTKAAAATVIGGSVTSLPPPPPTFHVDRPFLLAIVDDQVGMPLFLGVVEDPRP